MFKKLRNFLKNKEMVLNTVNIILGLFMLTALVVFWKTGNKISMYMIIFSGGLMNLCNGYQTSRQKDKRNMGHSMMLFGIVILVMGLVLMVL